MAELDLFAVSTPGTSHIVEAELKSLGFAKASRTVGGVELTGNLYDIYKLNLMSRTAGRILVRLASFQAAGYRSLEKKLKALDWGAWLNRSIPVKPHVTCRKTKMIHSGRVGDILLAAMGDAGGKDQGQAPQDIFLRIEDNRVTVSIDSSGDHLHMRGYRSHTGSAPIRENLAAACLLALGYDGSQPLMDPCTGSGTFAVEAALIATNTPPGGSRRFAFEQFKGFDPEVWKKVTDAAQSQVRTGAIAPIYASDIDPDAVALAARSANMSGMGELVSVAVCDLAELEPPSESGILVANPPYGHRLSGAKEVYASLRSMLKGPFSGWQWGVIELRKRGAGTLGMNENESLRFMASGLPLVFLMGGLMGGDTER